MKKTLRFLIPALLAIAIAVLAILHYMGSIVPKNPTDAVGNTPGNLLNKGLFCEYNGTLFFSNPYDKGRLYSMLPDCTEIRYLSDDSATYLNAYGTYLFYVKNNSKTSDNVSTIFRSTIYGVVRTSFTGEHSQTILSGYCTDLSLTGNLLLYNSNRNNQVITSRMDIKGKEETPVLSQDVDNASAVSGMIYYSNNKDNHAVYALNTQTGTTTLYCDGNTYQAMMYQGVLYYIDLDNSYALTKLDPNTQKKTVISSDYCVRYNIYNDTIFYQMEGGKDNTEHGMYRMKTDGSNRTKVVTGDVTSINCTSKYTFFQMNGSEDLYRVETTGDMNVQNFYIQADTQ